jgi:iron complex transport system ATP-binding protein
MSLLSVNNLCVTRRKRVIFRDVSFQIKAGEFVGLIGPNGAGKTTLMRAVLGLISATGHSNLASLDASARARQAAWMPQAREVVWPVSVETVVALGRIPYLPTGSNLSKDDQASVDVAIARMGLEDFRQRTVTRLSGGEQARVLIARMLAQETPLLMADEPIAGLDPANQITTMEAFANLAQEGRAVIASLHDLGLAVRHCTRLILLGECGIAADGTPTEVLTPNNLAQIFGVTAWYEQTPQGAIYQPLEII